MRVDGRVMGWVPTETALTARVLVSLSTSSWLGRLGLGVCVYTLCVCVGC